MLQLPMAGQVVWCTLQHMRARGVPSPGSETRVGQAGQAVPPALGRPNGLPHGRVNTLDGWVSGEAGPPAMPD